jgi:hypothetical protein
VALAFNWHFVVHPWLAFLAVLALGFFAVCLGMLIGLLTEQMSTVNLWMVVAMLLLIIPTIVLFMDSSSIPEWVAILMDWVPTVAAGSMLRMSFAQTVKANALLQPMATLGLFVLGAFSAVVYRLKLEDRA